MKITNKENAIKLLKNKYDEIKGSGEERYPKRSDFEIEQAAAIKASLGPWPRALESAGIKPPRNDDHRQKIKDKRIRAKRNRAFYQREPKAKNVNDK